MTLKEFLKHFIKLVNNEDVLSYQYVLISNSLKSDGSKENVCKFNALYPSPRTVSQWLSEHDEEEFVERYYAEVDECRTTLIATLDCALSQNIDVIFITGVEEARKIPYMDVIASYIYTEFGVPVYNFKNLRTGKEDWVEWDQDEARERIHKLCKRLKDDIDLDRLNNHDRNEHLKTLNKKELRKAVLEIGMSKKTTKEMSRKELIETLNDYYGNGNPDELPFDID